MQIDAEFVRNARLKRGWTQEVLAEISGLSPRTVQRIESQGVASNESLNGLCAALQVGREQLLAPPAGRAAAARMRALQIAVIVAAVAIGALVGALLTLTFT